MENQVKEKIKLSEILDICLEFKQNPTRENEDKLNKMMMDMKIVTYLPLLKKNWSLVYILNAVDSSDGDPVENAILMYNAKIIYGLFNYVLNFENDIPIHSLTYGIIDILHEVGLVDYILKFCKSDYEVLESLLKDTVNFANINSLSKLGEVFSKNNVEEIANTVRELKSELTVEKLKNLKSLMNSSDPMWKVFKETVADDVMDNIRNKELEEIDKKQN